MGYEYGYLLWIDLRLIIFDINSPVSELPTTMTQIMAANVRSFLVAEIVRVNKKIKLITLAQKEREK